MRNNSYPVYVWFTTLFIAPILFLFYTGFSESPSVVTNELKSVIGVITLFLGIILSLPSFIIYASLFRFLKVKSALIAKIILCLCALTCMFITFFLFLGKDYFLFEIKYNPFTNLFTAYAISIIISSFAYRYREKEV